MLPLLPLPVFTGLVIGLRARDHVASAPASLLWLSIHFRIQYKVALTLFFIHTNQCPYLSNKVIPLHSNPSLQRVRSSTGTNYTWFLKQEQTSTNDRSRWLGRSLWTLLTQTVHAIADKTAFKLVLKTLFFNIAYNFQGWYDDQHCCGETLCQRSYASNRTVESGLALSSCCFCFFILPRQVSTWISCGFFDIAFKLKVSYCQFMRIFKLKDIAAWLI